MIDREFTLDRRLPARLAELNTFIVLAAALEKQEPGSVELKIGSDIYTVSNARLLLDVMADGAVVISRTLLQFLGISYRKNPAALMPMTWQEDDLKITDLHLPRVEAAVATSGWPEGQQRADDLLKLCFATGNKVSAHFTTKTALMQSATIPDLCQAFILVTRLINREVYQAVGRPDVSFVEEGSHGCVVRQANRIL